MNNQFYIGCNFDILIDLGWNYKPYIITKEYKTVPFLGDEYKLAFYEFEILPPKEQYN